MSKGPSIRIGQRFKNNDGQWATVIGYEGCTSITLRFDAPYVYEVMTTSSNLKRGQVKNREAPSIHGWGILGTGSKTNPAYQPWAGMVERFKCPKFKDKRSTYRDVTVCAEWQWFENFEKWYNKQIKEEGWHLDKDWLMAKNKHYSPKTCVFVPGEINTFLVSGNRGEYPVGVELLPSGNYLAQSSGRNGRCLGTYSTANEAHNVYVLSKEKCAKELAKKWKGKIASKLLKALLNYKVSNYVTEEYGNE